MAEGRLLVFPLVPRPVEHVDWDTGERYRFTDQIEQPAVVVECPACRTVMVLCRDDKGWRRWRCMKCQPR